jgi:hypothetical protein
MAEGEPRSEPPSKGTHETSCLVQIAAVATIPRDPVRCGGSSTGGSAVTPTTPVNPAASPSANPVVAATVCERLGDGVLKAQCAKGSAAHYAAVEGAIDRLVQDRPQLFNLSDAESPGSYRVVDVDGYHQGLVDRLGATQRADDPTQTVLRVKASNDRAGFALTARASSPGAPGSTRPATLRPSPAPADGTLHPGVLLRVQLRSGAPEPDKWRRSPHGL